MLFSRQLPLSNLIELCRVLRHSLGAGIGLREVFRQQAERGAAVLRPVAGRVHAVLKRGGSLAAALEPEREVFPPLVLALSGVGEETGHLPEVFGELENYYRLQQRLLRQFRSRCTLPALQFVLAVAVVAAVFFILGWISRSRGTDARSSAFASWRLPSFWNVGSTRGGMVA